MKKSNLLDLMQRYVTGQLTAQEKRKVEAWLDLKKTDDGADLLLSPEDEERLYRAITNNIDNVGKIKSFRPRRRIRTLLPNNWLRAAAVLTILAIASYAGWFFGNRTTPSLETISTSGVDKTILDDGSIIWFQDVSHLTYGDYDNARQATFTGDALFEVAKDPDKPFIISCGEIKVEVIGTSFNLKSAADVFELRVLRGKVRVSSVLDPDGIVVTADEMAVYSSAEGIIKSPLPEDEASDAIADTEYKMVFDNTAMKTVLSRVETKFDVSVAVENPLVAKCRITADLTDNSLQGTMEILAELLDIGFTISGKKVVISGNGCN